MVGVGAILSLLYPQPDYYTLDLHNTETHHYNIQSGRRVLNNRRVVHVQVSFIN